MTVSFHSRSLQYKKLSCLQRRGRAQHCVAMLYCYFIPPTSSPRKAEHWKVPPLASSSPADRWSRSALWAPSSAKDAMPLSFLWDGLRRGSGVGSTTWNQELGPTWASLSWREPGRAGKGSHTHGCCVESIPASKVVAWWDVDSLIFGDLSVIAFCLGLRDRETHCRKWPQSCRCPGCYMELNWGGEHFLCIKHLLFCILLFLILLLLPHISYSIALCFQKIVISTHILCLCPSLIRSSRRKGTGLFGV